MSEEPEGGLTDADAYSITLKLVGSKTNSFSLEEKLSSMDETNALRVSKNASWLDARKYSDYDFYQYWIQRSDQEAREYLRFLTFLGFEEIENLERLHFQQPEEYLLQKKLPEEVTRWVRGEESFQNALLKNLALFGRATEKLTLRELEKLVTIHLSKKLLKKTELDFLKF